MAIETGLRHGPAAHYRDHLARFDLALVEHLLVHGPKPLDEGDIFGILWIEVVAESAIDKNIDDVPIGHESLEVEGPQQQRQNVLRADPFEAYFRTVPVFVQ